MEVTIKFDLDKEEDRKLYAAWTKMKEITLNLEKFRTLVWDASNTALVSEKQIELYTYFEEIIWKKLA